MNAYAVVCVVLLAPPAEQDQSIAVEMHSEAQRLRKQYSLKPQKLDEKVLQDCPGLG